MKPNFRLLLIGVAIIFFLSFAYKEDKSYMPANKKNELIEEWEKLRFGAFVHFNDNTFLEFADKEFSQNTDPKIFNPVHIDFDGMMATLQKAGVKYAVLTTRHTSGFCLWDSKYTSFDVANSPYKKDVVKLFVEACRKYEIKPCLYYCLWGGEDWDPTKWNPAIKEEVKVLTSKGIILSQLKELAENYGEIYEFWLDMKYWADDSLKSEELYNLIKRENSKTFVHISGHIQDGSNIRYFPTDILNGEESIPPVNGHNPFRKINGEDFYLPFELEMTSQRCDRRSANVGLMKGSVWFNYTDSQFHPVDSLYKYIRQSFDRGGSNILLSTAPDKTGIYRQADADSIVKLGKLISEYKTLK